jgi:hypothetical protein
VDIAQYMGFRQKVCLPSMVGSLVAVVVEVLTETLTHKGVTVAQVLMKQLVVLHLQIRATMEVMVGFLLVDAPQAVVVLVGMVHIIKQQVAAGMVG